MTPSEYDKFRSIFQRQMAEKSVPEIRAFKTFIRNFVFRMTPHQVLGIIKDLMLIERYKTSVCPDQERDEFLNIIDKNFPEWP